MRRVDRKQASLDASCLVKDISAAGCQSGMAVWEGEYHNNHQSCLIIIEDKVRHQQLKDGLGVASWGLPSKQLRQSSKE